MGALDVGDISRFYCDSFAKLPKNIYEHFNRTSLWEIFKRAEYFSRPMD